MNHALCVDASVAVKWLLPEPDHQLADALLADAGARALRIVGPPHLTVEVASAIQKRVHRAELSLESAQARLRRFGVIPLRLAAPPALAPRALELCHEFGWSYPYDAFYLAVGELLDCEVWTADGPFHRDASSAYPRLRLLADFAATQ